MRGDLTATEKLLWRHLKSSAFPCASGHFRKQVPIGQYIVDFAHHQSRLIVELDGPHHDFPGRPEKDAQRQAWMLAQGYRVLRFRNEEVWRRLPDILAQIRQLVPPPPAPSPQGGGGMFSEEEP